ncbi:hypothetical protein [Nostoc sp.]|uniref:hypothetical protein n=1 Tax=Nostoc sp. TaxID=1180 RepID=UPI002FF541EC
MEFHVCTADKQHNEGESTTMANAVLNLSELNGSASGFGSGGLFATLTGAPTFTASDFVLQA